MPKARGAAGLAMAMAVGGCAMNDHGGVMTASLGRQVAVTQAFMVPPPGGPGVVAVLEQRFANALAQDIILENNTGAAGQNVLFVRAFGPMGRDAGTETLDPDIPDLVSVRRELRERFPGIHMEVSGLYAQNRYGPLSYATGRTRSGANCIYVWQRIAAEPGLFRLERGSITWRLRLCDPNTSIRDLLLTAYGFTVSGYFKSKWWNPFGPPPEPDPRIGKPGEVILPEQPVDPTVVPPNAFGAARTAAVSRPARSRSTRRRSRPRTRPAVRQVVDRQPAQAARPTVLNQPVPGAAVVPRPENTNLAEPNIQGSNLPSTAPRAAGRLTVPRPGARTVPAPATAAPSTLAPPPPGPRVILPRPQASAVRGPQVRVIGTN
ncbi:MAG: cellulose biosynthesis protein BcsN [Pseudomonadota bacterium]